jgi:putative membrane protein
MTRTLPLVITVFLFSIVSSLHAEDAYPGDSVFIKQAAMHGMFDVKAGKLALRNAGSEDVKVYGGVMVVSHSKLNDQLKMMAKLKGWTLPETLDTTYQALVDEFEDLNRTDFDREYSMEMSKIHSQDKESFHNATKYASDPDLKAWAAQVEPLIKEHIELEPHLVQTTVTRVQIVK